MIAVPGGGEGNVTLWQWRANQGVQLTRTFSPHILFHTANNVHKTSFVPDFFEAMHGRSVSTFKKDKVMLMHCDQPKATTVVQSMQ